MAYYVSQALLSFFACLIGQPWSAALAQEGSLTLPVRPGDAVALTLTDGLSDQDASSLLRVFVGSPKTCCAGRTPIAGTYSVDGQTVIFDPAFEFITGQIYTAKTMGTESSLAAFAIPADSDISTPEVVAIYPSGPDIPENTLRFYIQFSAPMMPHRAYEFIKLLDVNGKADTAAFMSFTQELWSEDRTQLTLLMDPGRIKRGVAQNVELGPALLEGNRYSIVIEEGWPSANGGQEAPRFEQPFVVSAALRSLPDVSFWRVDPPTLATRDPLIISFDRPFDQQLARSAIAVRDADSQVVSGTVSIEASEKRWRFRPDDVWTSSTLTLVVGAHLEDVAGNNFWDLLDHAVGTNAKIGDHHEILLELAPTSQRSKN